MSAAIGYHSDAIIDDEAMNDKLAQDADTITAESPAVACDGGGGGPLGHPRVFLRIGETGEIVCPYCSRRFVLAEGASADAGH
jgi:uncharacterized Zn-finger protein